MCGWLKYELNTQLISTFKTSFCNEIEFSTTENVLKIQYLLHLISKKFEIRSIESHTSRALQHLNQECAPTSLTFLV
jgi:hypothetical protein